MRYRGTEMQETLIRAEVTKVTCILKEHMMPIIDAVASSVLFIYCFPYNCEDILNDFRWIRGFGSKRGAILTWRPTIVTPLGVPIYGPE